MHGIVIRTSVFLRGGRLTKFTLRIFFTMVGSITFAAANSFITLLVVMLAGYFFFPFICPLRGGHAHAEIEGIPMVEPLEFRASMKTIIGCKIYT